MLASGCLALVLSFQNCSDFSLQSQLIYDAAILDSQTLIDADAFPRLLEASELTRWYKSTQPAFIDSPTKVGDQVGVIIAIKRTYTGEILKIHDSGSPTKDVAALSIAGGKVRATRSDATGAYEEYKESLLPSSGDLMVVGASFGEAGKIELLVNGMVEKSAVVVATGTPAAYAFVNKGVTVTAATSNFSEYMIYTGDESSTSTSLDNKELNALSRYLGTNHLISQVRFDPSLITPTTPTTPTESAEFLAAKSLFDAKCIHCHRAGLYAPDLVNLTEAKAKSLGLVVPGNPTSSKLYYRLQGGPGPSATMPTDGSISPSELQAVQTWINSL